MCYNMYKPELRDTRAPDFMASRAARNPCAVALLQWKTPCVTSVLTPAIRALVLERARQ
jgi:hypothetical protein